MNAENTYKAHFSLALATMIFGANYWIAKGLMPDFVSPQQLVLLRVVGACFLYWALGLAGPGERVKKNDLIRMALAALFGITLNQLLFFIGLNLSTPVDVAIIHVSNPIFVLIIAALMIKERISTFKVAGILLGAGGAVVLITYRGDLSFNSDTFTGNLMAVLNTLAYAIYLVIIKPLMNKYKSVTIMKWVFVFGSLFTIPVTINSAIGISFDGFTSYTWFSLLFVIVATTFFAYLFTIYALKFVEASVVSYYIYLQPIIATLISFWLGIQLLTWQHGLAAAMIFTGVYLVSKKIRIKPNIESNFH
ncbi:MAG: EamA family transporter [Bacteroidales bacterium]|nr:EamA family transporter [Bacteroidales bacterium]